MSATRDQLIAALEAGDEATVRRLGWWPVLAAVDQWWAPKQRCTPRQLAPYARLIGDHDPAAVLEALTELAGEWRPHPAAVLGALNRKGGEARMDAGRSRDRSRSSDALAATRAALAAGEQPCECGCPTGITWRPDGLEHRSDHRGSFALPIGVWRCPDCNGIEPGQVNAAEDQITDLADAA